MTITIPATANPTTPICAIAAELNELWKDINLADSASVSRTGRGVPAPIILEKFLNEANGRVQDLEDYLLTLAPQSLPDVVVLLSVLSSQVDAPETADMGSIASGTTIQDLGGKALDPRLSTWSEDVQAVRAWLAQPKSQQASDELRNPK